MARLRALSVRVIGLLETHLAKKCSAFARDLMQSLSKLKKRGVLSLLVEGGAGLAASFLAGNHVDRLVIFRAPIILGEGALGGFSGIASQEVQHAPRFTLLETRALG